ncbi:hypothetical protein [Zamilon virus]|uniref:Uncharacterized protein n=1 Tax=Zamilon virus TaxID=1411887 RepID=V6BPQ2_9VIRU|nr:hypothetical protein X812_gp16 [Zamilon virus]AVL93342.1 hypothetical protein za3_2 [Zamilon virus]CDI70059.1 hypothetical protein [Zamilon virus]
MNYTPFNNENNEIVINSGGMPRVEKPFDMDALYNLFDNMTTEQLDDLIEDINDEKKLREFRAHRTSKIKSRMNREFKAYRQELENQKHRLKIMTEQESDEEEEEQPKQKPVQSRKNHKGKK